MQKNKRIELGLVQIILSELEILYNLGTHVQPLCKIIAWYLSGLEPTGELPSGDPISMRFLQSGRTTSLGALTVNNEVNGDMEPTYEFRIQIRLRGNNEALSVVNRIPINVKLTLGCFEQSTLSVALKPNASHPNLVRLSGKLLYLVVPKTRLSERVLIDLQPLIEFVSDIDFCGADSVTAFVDSKLSQQATLSSEITLVLNPSKKSMTTGELRLDLAISYSPFSRFPIIGYLQAKSRGKGQSGIDLSLLVSVTQCNDFVTSNKDAVRINMLEGQTGTKVKLLDLFTMEFKHPGGCSGHSFSLSSAEKEIVPLWDGDILLQGNFLTLKAERPRSYQFYVHITLTKSLNSAGLLFLVNVKRDLNNKPPSWAEDIFNLMIECKTTFFVGGLFAEDKVFNYKSPVASDPEGDPTEILVQGAEELRFVTITS